MTAVINNEVEALGAENANEVLRAVWPWVCRQRWCPTLPATSEAGGSRDEVRVLAAWWLGTKMAEPPATRALLLVVAMGPAGPILQVPLLAGERSQRGQSGEDSATIGTTELWNLRDGSVEPVFWKGWAKAATVLKGTREELLRAATRVRPLGMEQSNTSVILAGGPTLLIAKVFRVLHPGSHPEVELPEALTRSQFAGVPTMYATWYLPQLDSHSAGSYCSAVVSEMLSGATDGFDLFVKFASEGADPSGEAYRLGILTAEMHDGLAKQLGLSVSLSPTTLTSRVEEALEAVTQEGYGGLVVGSDLAGDLARILDDASEHQGAPLATQRIHGDLHLGQTLRTPDGSWYVLDFEGEPLKDIATRSVPDVAVRDVAGMLRSFDYAWRRAQVDPDIEGWTRRAQQAFLEGYGSYRELLDTDVAALEILQIEKALYEVQYEAQFRPDYLPVPLDALKALAESHDKKAKMRDLNHD
ncbi:phosphotransferase [Actinomyces minihominis]|uniref:phosphotransferase n=1 Tax=Actinomyces minihominis TaxID=2002838 RepID=UPI000C06E605|nr:phosphotransferase [Actinomyces minihominis]